MSRKSRFLGGVLCLAGGYIVGFGSYSQPTISAAMNAIQGSISSIPYVDTVQNQLSYFEWILTIGFILFLVGALLVIRGAQQREPVQLRSSQAVRSTEPVCKFCAAPMKGSTTYCPNCGRSQN